MRLLKQSTLERKASPQRLKPDSLHSIYVRPEGRTLHGLKARTLRK
jgi:hypothetical protein